MSQSTPSDAPSGQEPRSAPPPLDDSIQQIAQESRDAFQSVWATGRALRRLMIADLLMARSAIGYGLAWICVVVIFGGSSWLLLTGVVIAFLQRCGLSWLQAIFFTSITSLVVTGIAAWRALHFFELSSFQSTRRQLRRLGLISDDEDDDDPPHPSKDQSS